MQAAQQRKKNNELFYLLLFVSSLWEKREKEKERKQHIGRRQFINLQTGASYLVYGNHTHTRNVLQKRMHASKLMANHLGSINGKAKL